MEAPTNGLLVIRSDNERIVLSNKGVSYGNMTLLCDTAVEAILLKVLACRTGVIFCVNRGESEANARRARSASGARGLLPSRATRASRSPRFRLCLRKKSRLFCMLNSTIS